MKKLLLIVGLLVLMTPLAGCQHTTLGKRMEIAKQRKAELSWLDDLYAPLILEAKKNEDMDRQVELYSGYLEQKRVIEARYDQMDRDLTMRSIESSLRGIDLSLR